MAKKYLFFPATLFCKSCFCNQAVTHNRDVNEKTTMGTVVHTATRHLINLAVTSVAFATSGGTASNV